MQIFIIITAILVFNSLHVSECQDCAIARGVSHHDKHVIVKQHNILRNKVATGGQPPQPSASNMRKMRWNDDLAAGAQEWADQCDFEHNDGSARSTDQFPYVGQNLKEAYGANASDTLPVFKYAIDSWYAEVSNFDPANIAPFVYNYDCGHYTQVVWAETTDVGCGYSYFLDTDNTYTKLHVCNYGPAGNFEQGAIMYQAGPACSNCTNQCSEKYGGLCE